MLLAGDWGYSGCVDGEVGLGSLGLSQDQQSGCDGSSGGDLLVSARGVLGG